MNSVSKQRGFLLIVAVILIAVAATMAAVIVTLTVGSGQSGGLHVQSTRALFAAQSGIEHATRLFSQGTTCGTIAATIGTVTVGDASYTVSTNAYPTGPTTTLSAAVSSTDTTIPVGSTADYASHGRIRINGEDILYSDTTATSFTGAVRGYAATTIPATHASGSTVGQDLCLMTSVGTSGSTVRTVELGVQSGPWSAFLDTAAAVNIGTTETVLATLTPNFPAGDNIVLAIVSMQNTQTGGGARTTISAGDLWLERSDGTLLDFNALDVRVGDGNIDNDDRPEKTFFLLALDSGVAAGVGYSVRAFADDANTNAQVKLLIINNPPASAFNAATDGDINDAAQDTIVSVATTFPTGTNLVIAWAHFHNEENSDRTIDAGDLRLRRTTAPATILATNQYDIALRRDGDRPNREHSMLLVAQDVGAPANSTYLVSAQASGDQVEAEANIVVIHGLGGAFVDGGSTDVLTTSTTLASLATTFPALYPGRSNLLIAPIQYQNGTTATRDINAGDESIRLNADTTDWSENFYRRRLCTSGTAQCRHFSGGLLWRHSAAIANPATYPSANPTYSVVSAANNTDADGEAKILGIHLDPIASRQEILP